MTKKELTDKYEELIRSVESMRVYDGRGKGIDVYTCDKCGAKFYTQYIDKGVTPFVISCRSCQRGDAVHRNTIDLFQWLTLKAQGEQVHNWVRPTLEQFLNLSPGAQVHVLQGGLMLEEELK